MAVIGQSHLIWRSRVADHISHSNTIVRIVPIEVGHSYGQSYFTGSSHSQSNQLAAGDVTP